MNEKPFSGPRCKVDPVYLRKPQAPEGHHPYPGKAKKKKKKEFLDGDRSSTFL